MNKFEKLFNLSLFSLLIVLVFSSIFYLFDYNHFDGFTIEEDRQDKFLNRVYFTVTTFSSTGYGDVAPKSRPVKILSMLLQFMLILTVVGSILE